MRFFWINIRTRGEKWVVLLLLLTSCSTLDLTREPSAGDRGEYIQFIEKSAPSEDAFVAVQRLAAPAIEQKDWNGAALVYSEFKPKFPTMAARFDTILAILNAPEDTVPTVLLGDSINTAADEFLPVITVDGKTLYFCRDNISTDDDVMVSHRIDTGLQAMVAGYKTVVNDMEGKWTSAEHVSPPIFTIHSEAPTGVSPDGNRLLLFGNYDMPMDSIHPLTDTFGGSTSGPIIAKANLFYSDKQDNGDWGQVKPFPWPINSSHFECDAKLSSDGKELFFVSDRPGGIGQYHPKPRGSLNGPFFHGSLWGNTDIYVSIKQPDGSWGMPINLGPKINTPYAERSPFLHPDGKTLYFASEGHAGIGGLDIYRSVRLDSSDWTKWSTPVNLGKAINTAGADWGYVLSTDGTTAYMTVANKSLHNYDIACMTLPKAVRPAGVATITGKITDDKGKPVVAKIKWDDLESGKNVGEISSDPVTGSFFIALPLGRNYAYYAERQGYFPVSKNLDLRHDTVSGTDSTIHLDVDVTLASIKNLQASDSSIRLNNIFFDFNKITLNPESYSELDRLAAILRTTPDVHVEIDAYTDNKGPQSYNVELSKRRAQSVVDYLVTHGTASSRLTARGLGNIKPIATNETDEGRAQNRRVEFRFPKDEEAIGMLIQ
ncbi:MAG TPA: OmpA family protein [Candidatus Kapabacteria bacterium]|jgi:outer membrane protein OmpA-like peptidoglycan-associated protein